MREIKKIGADGLIQSDRNPLSGIRRTVPRRKTAHGAVSRSDFPAL